MSVASCIQGLESMTLGGAGASQMDAGQVTTLDDGYCITERYAAAGAIQKVGGLDGVRVVMNFLFMNLDSYLPPLLPRTVNGTGHTGPSEFCATSI